MVVESDVFFQWTMLLFSLPQCISVVNNARNGAYGEDRIMAVELKYGGKQKKDSFLMFSAAWVDNKGPQRVLGFAPMQ